MIHIFVSGATGFVGSKLTINLAKKGFIVHALYRCIDKTKILHHPNIKLFKGSLNNEESLIQAMKNCQGIFHTAAYVSLWTKNPQIFYETNIKGTQTAIDIAKYCGIKRAVFTSSAGTFGPSNQSYVTESNENTESYMNDYEKSKREADQIILKANSNLFETIIVYPTRIFGPGPIGPSNSITTMIEKYINGRWHFIPGDGKSIANYVFVDDIVDGHIKAFLKGKAGEKYILGGSNLSYNELFSLIKGISGKSYFLIKIPKVIMQIIASLMLLQTHITGKPLLVTNNFIKKALSNHIVSYLKAINQLDYHPTPIKEALLRTINWINQQ